MISISFVYWSIDVDVPMHVISIYMFRVEVGCRGRDHSEM